MPVDQTVGGGAVAVKHADEAGAGGHADVADAVLDDCPDEDFEALARDTLDGREGGGGHFSPDFDFGTAGDISYLLIVVDHRWQYLLAAQHSYSFDF